MRKMCLSALLVLAACGADDTAEKASVPGPSDAQVQNALAAKGIDTGGNVEASVSGGKTGNARMTDVTFCITRASVGTMKMDVFALAGNNDKWAISIGYAKGMPALGEHKFDPAIVGGLNASLIDKSTGKAPSEWQQYNATSGTLTLTAADAKHVAGSYEFTASPSYPSTTGAPVSVKGTFDAPPAANCDLASIGVK